MPDDAPLPAVERDFDAIEAAVMETARGRWFLAEFNRRNRVADTQVLLDAISRLGTAAGMGPGTAGAAVAGDLDAMALALRTAQGAIARSDDEGEEVEGVLSAAFASRIVLAARRANADILDATERMQEAAWSLRDAGVDPVLCDALDRQASRILKASAFQDRNAARTQILLDALGTIEERIGTMRRRILAGAASPAGRAGLSGEPEASPPADRPEAPAAAPARPVPASLAAIDALDFRERLKLFT